MATYDTHRDDTRSHYGTIDARHWCSKRIARNIGIKNVLLEYRYVYGYYTAPAIPKCIVRIQIRIRHITQHKQFSVSTD
jgi:hypothetical protein